MFVKNVSFPEYPFKSHFLSVNGQQMHFLDEGDSGAPPVVMVHGNPTWSFFFRKAVLALRGSYRCIVPDHIGMGLSGKPPQAAYGYRLHNRIDDLQALLEQLGIRERIILLLHDWGGMIGMGYAGRQPQRIAAAVILNSAAFQAPADAPLPWQLRLARSVLGPLLVQGLNAFCRGARNNCVVRAPLDPRVRHAYLAPYNNWHNRLAVLRFVQDIPLTPQEPSYDVVTQVDRGLVKLKKIPMCLCWGMQDFMFTPGFLEQWRARFPDAEVHTFASAGHYLLEDAADEVIPIIRKFLKRAPLNKNEYNQAAREA